MVLLQHFVKNLSNVMLYKKWLHDILPITNTPDLHVSINLSEKVYMYTIHTFIILFNLPSTFLVVPGKDIYT